MGMLADSNVSSNKSVTIMSFNPNRLQVTTYHPQGNKIIERMQKIINDMLISFDFETIMKI
jgi:hypothetical protein